MAVRFLHLADLHLGSRHEYLGDDADQRAGEVMETFRQAVNVALDPERGIDGVLISGNLFDRHRPDPETLSFVRGLLGRLVAEKRPRLRADSAQEFHHSRAGHGWNCYR